MQQNGLLQNGKQDMPVFYNQHHVALTRGGISHILQKYVNMALLRLTVSKYFSKSISTAYLFPPLTYFCTLCSAW
jgi:site-specific recombinase XerD